MASSELSVEPSTLALAQFSVSTNDAFVPNMSNHYTSDFPPSSRGLGCIRYTLHMSRDVPFVARTMLLPDAGV